MPGAPRLDVCGHKHLIRHYCKLKNPMLCDDTLNDKQCRHYQCCSCIEYETGVSTLLDEEDSAKFSSTSDSIKNWIADTQHIEQPEQPEQEWSSKGQEMEEAAADDPGPGAAPPTEQEQHREDDRARDVDEGVHMDEGVVVDMEWLKQESQSQDTQWMAAGDRSQEKN
ncbi:uncharacterized protein L3040_002357 [Drepanopeziza brunnea f. sp. 'multigermtubi']|nr:hypothetical protein L3040_002357 [Drepanopeziza brunnea f. sp. 'multigermtubi']